jgi:hypothetical protein
MLSIGTGAAKYKVQPPGEGDDGMLWWVTTADGHRGQHAGGRHRLPGEVRAGRPLPPRAVRHGRQGVGLDDVKGWGLDDVGRLTMLVTAGRTLAQQTAAAVNTTFFEGKVTNEP